MNDPTGELSEVSKTYFNLCASDYITLIRNYGNDMMQNMQDMQAAGMANNTMNLNVYENQKVAVATIDTSQMFEYNFNFIYGIMNNQTEIRRKDSYLYLRSNYFQFSTNLLSFA